MKALALKELREVAGIAAVAVAVYLALVVNVTGAKVFEWVPLMPSSTLNTLPFSGDGFTDYFALVSVVFALALGFRQSAWEASQGTYLFLLHRPVRRNSIFLLKIGTGLGVFAACASLPILLYGWWASVPGHRPAPFAWSMSGPAWHFVALVPIAYLGAFLSGLRPARWFGTRLFPVLGALAAFLWLSQLTWFWVINIVLAITISGLLLASITLVARERDYA